VRVKFFFLILFQLVSLSLFSQILDDSTQNVYGPTTTTYTYIDDIKLNRKTKFYPDTSIIDFEKFTYMSVYDNKLQDLGNIATSTKPMYYTPPSVIGRTSGFYSYDLYSLPVEDIHLYDTRSPYTSIYAIFAGGNRNITRINHSQSIKPNWNFGLNLQWLTMNKQYSSTGRGDNQVEGLSYNGYMYYWNKDSSYFIMGAISRMNHEIAESGGVDTTDFENINDFFDFDNIDVNLEYAKSSELKVQYYLYQQYQVKKLFAIYNEFERTLTSNYFTDENLSEDGDYFDQILFNETQTYQKNKFRDLTNEAGIKGDLKKAFYNAYYRYRYIEFVHPYLPEIEKRTEGYLGGSLRYDNDSSYYLMVAGELMNNGNHQLSAIYENRFWELSYKRLMYDPGSIHERYFSNHYEWYNDFGAVQSDNFKALFKVPLKMITIKPYFNLSMVKNYIYFDTDKMPSQATGFAQLYSPGIDFNIDFGKYLHWVNTFIYTFKTGEEEAQDVFRIPSIFVNSNLYFSKMMFNEKMLMTFGLNTHYQSNYFADGYDPVTQQFYVQNDFEIPSYFLADVYVNIQIKTVKLFLKMSYINQKNQKGYFATPDYPGQPKNLDLGLSWMFYD